MVVTFGDAPPVYKNKTTGPQQQPTPGGYPGQSFMPQPGGTSPANSYLPYPAAGGGMPAAYMPYPGAANYGAGSNFPPYPPVTGSGYPHPTATSSVQPSGGPGYPMPPGNGYVSISWIIFLRFHALITP